MRRKWITAIPALALALSMVGCGGGEETTVSGMVVSVEGSVVTLMEMSENMQGGFGGMFQDGERPERPEGSEDFTRPEGMEDFSIPEDFDFENFNPEDMPEGFDPENKPEGFGGMFPGGEMPEDGERPQMPENGEMPDRGPMGSVEGMGETSAIDVADAHISVEIDGVKASGSMSDLVPGAFVTITLDGKGNATYVLVSSSGFFGGFAPSI